MWAKWIPLHMARTSHSEISIADISSNYRFDWSIHDFLVSDEQHYLRIHDMPTHVDGYVIGICTRGQARIKVNRKEYKGGTNSMIITSPQQVLQVLETSKNFRCRFIVFSKRFLTASFINPHILESFRFSEAGAVPVIRLEERSAQELLSQFIYIWKRFNETAHPYRREITGNLLMVLLHDFEAIYQQQSGLSDKKRTRKEELYRKFNELLFRHFRQQHGVQFYAEQLFITPKHLTETIKELTGHTAGEWIERTLALEAEMLLQHPDYAVQQVSAMLNFPDQSTFGKFFKKQTGASPNAYRKGQKV